MNRNALPTAARGRGSDPSLRDFEAAMSEAGRRRRRRGARTAGAGVALLAVTGLAIGVGGAATSSSAPDEIQFVDDAPGERDVGDTEVTDLILGVPAGPADETAQTVARQRRRRGGEPSSTSERSIEARPARPTTRTSAPLIVAKTCRTDAEWCLSAGAVRAGATGYTISSTMCLNTGVPLGALDYPTAQEVDFEVLSGARVIWRWSDGQSFTPTPHRLSALPADCFTWRTLWDQHDSTGARVGKARLTLRVSTHATQRTDASRARVVFQTTAT